MLKSELFKSELKLLLCNLDGPLQCFSTHFQKSNKIGVLRPIFPDYAISRDYVLNNTTLLKVHHKEAISTNTKGETGSDQNTTVLYKQVSSNAKKTQC